MPSFLSKVFGRKKDEKEPSDGQARDAEPSLLDGKFEAVSPTVSVTAAKFAEGAGTVRGREKEKDKDKEFGFALFKARSTPSSPNLSAPKRFEPPHLSLNLPSLKTESTSRPLDSLFEDDSDASILLSDSVIGEQRLSPSDTLILVRACAQAITTRGGLNALGIMHPHWYSTSPDIQRRLISLFIHSLASKGPSTTLPSSSISGPSFGSEIDSARSPHDVAAVLRWGIRHLQLEGSSFGLSNSWYKTFFDGERDAGYPANAFSDKLIGQLPPAHVELLTATLDIMSSLAAHAEANSTSGSKLSKLFGLWILAFPRTEPSDDWSSFYNRWELAGRMLEHIFLARIRDEGIVLRLPTRLSELVQHYPYNKNESSNDTGLLARPLFTTKSYPSLFVRIETQVAQPSKEAKPHLLELIEQAFNAEPDPENPGRNADLWMKIRSAVNPKSAHGSASTPSLTISQVFADDTLRLLGKIPLGPAKINSPDLSALLPPDSGVHRHSYAGGDAANVPVPATAPPYGSPRPPASTPPNKSATPSIPMDWSKFSTSGFFESDNSTTFASTLGLLDQETSATQAETQTDNKFKGPAFRRGRRSPDRRVSPESPAQERILGKPNPKSTRVSVVQVDEAFIDFWNDALLDPISSSWPSFVVCKLKSSEISIKDGITPIHWLVIEHVFIPPPAPASPVPTDAATDMNLAKGRRPSSPRPSFRSDISHTISATRKKFSLFGRRQSTDVSSIAKPGRGKQSSKAPTVGEMGEILAEREEDEANVKAGKEKDQKADAPIIRVPSPKPRKSTDDTAKKSLDVGKGVAIGAALAGTGAVAAGAAVVASAQVAHEFTKDPAAAEPEPPKSSIDTSASEKPAGAPFVREASPGLVQVPATKASVVPAKKHTSTSAAPLPAARKVVTAQAQSLPSKLAGDKVPNASSVPVLAVASKPEVPTAPAPEEPSLSILSDAQSKAVEESKKLVADKAPTSEAKGETVPDPKEPESMEEPTKSAPAYAPTAENVAIQEPEAPATVPERVAAPETSEEATPKRAAPVPLPAEESTPEPTTEFKSEAEESHLPVEPTVTPEDPESVIPRIETDTGALSDDQTPAPESSYVSAVSSPQVSDGLPAVPIIDVPLVGDRLLSVQPLKLSEDKPRNGHAHSSVNAATEKPGATDEPAKDELPPAPESVVLAGETPGPQIALSTSEPAAIEKAAEDHAAATAPAGESTVMEPVISETPPTVDAQDKVIKEEEPLHPNGNGAATRLSSHEADADNVAMAAPEKSDDVDPPVAQAGSEPATDKTGETDDVAENAHHEGNGAVKSADEAPAAPLA